MVGAATSNISSVPTTLTYCLGTSLQDEHDLIHRLLYISSLVSEFAQHLLYVCSLSLILSLSPSICFLVELRADAARA